MNACKCDLCGRKLDCESYEYPVAVENQYYRLCDLCYFDWLNPHEPLSAGITVNDQ